MLTSALLLLLTVLFSDAGVSETAPTSDREYESAPAESTDEEPPVDVRRQVQRLMNAGLPFAEKMLADHGQFFPFGAVMLPDGLIRAVGAPEDLEQTPEVLYARMVEGLRAGAAAGSYRAAAMFSNVAMQHPEDGRSIAAVRVALEHRDGYCIDVFFPIDRRGDVVELGDSFAAPRTGTLFPSCN